MKKIVLQRSTLLLVPLSFLLFLFSLFISYRTSVPLALEISINGFFFTIFFFSCVVVNRFCCVIYFDKERVYRRGFFVGFRTFIEINSILYIKKVRFYRDGFYYCLVDNKHYHTSRGRKNSSIFIPYSEKGYNFIKQFYNGNIPPFKEYEDLLF